MRHVRSYPDELPVLAGLLPQIHTPVQVIVGAHDNAAPPVNAEFLARRLPRSWTSSTRGTSPGKMLLREFAALITSWWAGGYKTATRTPTRY
jgi:pimeloyl-ACP methyl ester carboxylesterase